MQEFTADVEGAEDREARVYELAFHIVPSVGDEGLPAEVETIHALIAKHKGTIVSEEAPQLMRLAYPIERTIARAHKTFDSAYFGWVIFEAFPNDAHAVKEAMRTNEHVARFIVLKTEKDAPPVRHPAHAPRHETKPTDFVARTHEKTTRVAPEEGLAPMTTEQMDAEIEKLVV